MRRNGTRLPALIFGGVAMIAVGAFAPAMVFAQPGGGGMGGAGMGHSGAGMGHSGAGMGHSGAGMGHGNRGMGHGGRGMGHGGAGMGHGYTGKRMNGARTSYTSNHVGHRGTSSMRRADMGKDKTGTGMHSGRADMGNGDSALPPGTYTGAGSPGNSAGAGTAKSDMH